VGATKPTDANVCGGWFVPDGDSFIGCVGLPFRQAQGKLTWERVFFKAFPQGVLGRRPQSSIVAPFESAFAKAMADKIGFDWVCFA